MQIRAHATLDDFIASGRDFHVMRDFLTHHQYLVLGGMWGARGGFLRLIDRYLITVQAICAVTSCISFKEDKFIVTIEINKLP